MYKRGLGLTIRKEDMHLSFLHKGTYTGVLSTETKTILSRINDFLCFPQFVPGNLLFDEGAVKVFLDDREERTSVVTPEELEDELNKTKEELKKLRDILEKHGQSKNDDKSLSELNERCPLLEKKVSEIERRLGVGDYLIKTELLGYYHRRILADGSSQPEIHLMIGTLGEDYILTAITFGHELMHAYFDHHDTVTGNLGCRSIEEPLAEYGMLCFMEMFSRIFSCYKGLMSRAESLVKAKRYALGVCDYGYGLYLFKDKEKYCVDWISLYHNACTTRAMTSDAMKKYLTMISPIKYPLHEKASAICLEKALRSNQFCFTANIRTCRSDTDMYITVPKDMPNHGYFDSCYPPKSSIRIIFEDKKGQRVEGEASVVVQSRIHILKDLFKEYINNFGTSPRTFELREISASNAEWIAKEV